MGKSGPEIAHNIYRWRKPQLVTPGKSIVCHISASKSAVLRGNQQGIFQETQRSRSKRWKNKQGAKVGF